MEEQPRRRKRKRNEIAKLLEAARATKLSTDAAAAEERTDEAGESNSESSTTPSQTTKKKRSKKKNKKKKESKPGIIYLSRVPPGMKPVKIRHLLSKIGPVDRLYLAPENELIRRKRMKSGGNSRKKYTEGWVEFKKRSHAKLAESLLNTRPIGGKKRSYWAEDLWSIKYLKSFQWHHLTERIAHENRVHDMKLRQDIRQVRKETASYRAKVEKSEKVEKMKERKRKEGRDTRTSTRKNFIEISQKAPVT